MNLKERMNLDIYVDEKTTEAEQKKKIIELLIAVFGICAFVFTGYFNQVLSASVAGITFLLLGIIGLYYNKKHNVYPEKDFLPAAFSVLGLALGLIPPIGMLLALNGFVSEDSVQLLILLTEGLLILILGLIITAYPLYYAAAKKRRCTCFVTATCITPVCVRQIRGSSFYEHLWEFTLNGETVHVSDRIQVGTEKPYPGTVEQFIVNPHDPQDLYRKRPVRMVLFILLGITICFIGLLALIPACILLWR